MVKIILLLLAFGLSTLTTLLLNFDAAWKVAISIIGMGIGFIIVFALIFFLIPILFGLRVKKGEIATKYSKTYHHLYSMYQIFGLSLFGVKLTTNGLDMIPKDTNFVLVQNHTSNLDPMFTDAILRKYPLIFVSKESLFRLPFFGKIITHIGYVKLSRKNAMNDASEIVRGVRWTRAGEVCLGIYPEGTRNKTYPNPELLNFKEGSISMIKKASRPIVVSVMRGTRDVNKGLLTRVHKVQFDVVKVISSEQVEALSIEELEKEIREVMLDGIRNPSTKKEKVRLY